MTDPAVDAARGGRVLVVDDDERNRELLRDLLEIEGHEVLEARDGSGAIRVATESAPEVLLLDVMMPGISGLDVCRALKGRPETRSIPILLVTALTDRASRIAGIEAGAADFLSKPLDREELLLRLRNALASKRLHDRLQQNFIRLRELEAMRDSLTHMLVHDLKSPLAAILGYLDLVLLGADRLDAEDRGYLEVAMRNTRSLGDMVRAILDVNLLEENRMPLELTVCDARDLVREAASTQAVSAEHCRLALELPAEPVPAFCDAGVTRRVLGNLMSNALKYTPKTGEVRATATPAANGRFRLAVSDTGPGIPRDLQSKIFEKFFHIEARQRGAVYSTGLGLTFCKLAVEAHGGRIGVDSEPGHGSTFWFELAAAPADR